METTCVCVYKLFLFHSFIQINKKVCLSEILNLRYIFVQRLFWTTTRVSFEDKFSLFFLAKEMIKIIDQQLQVLKTRKIRKEKKESIKLIVNNFLLFLNENMGNQMYRRTRLWMDQIF